MKIFWYFFPTTALKVDTKVPQDDKSKQPEYLKNKQQKSNTHSKEHWK